MPSWNSLFTYPTKYVLVIFGAVVLLFCFIAWYFGRASWLDVLSLFVGSSGTVLAAASFSPDSGPSPGQSGLHWLIKQLFNPEKRVVGVTLDPKLLYAGLFLVLLGMLFSTIT